MVASTGNMQGWQWRKKWGGYGEDQIILGFDLNFIYFYLVEQKDRIKLLTGKNGTGKKNKAWE
jgi:hypothetical protein